MLAHKIQVGRRNDVLLYDTKVFLELYDEFHWLRIVRPVGGYLNATVSVALLPYNNIYEDPDVFDIVDIDNNLVSGVGSSPLPDNSEFGQGHRQTLLNNND